jgi:DNA invertase Pin-like site-specific DNA recombinase
MKKATSGARLDSTMRPRKRIAEYIVHAEIKSGALFDAVLVYKLDRFARSLSHLTVALQEFKALHVEFISITESIDTSTPAGRRCSE